MVFRCRKTDNHDGIVIEIAHLDQNFLWYFLHLSLYRFYCRLRGHYNKKVYVQTPPKNFKHEA